MKKHPKSIPSLSRENEAFSLPEFVRPLIKSLSDIRKQKKVKVFLVGGFLRDYLLGRGCFDFDFAVEKDALKLSRAFAQKIKGAYVLLDEDRGCARVVKKTPIGIVTFDFADFRGKNLKSDLSQRDFTINTFCIDIEDVSQNITLSKILLDSQKGLADLKAQRIKMVSKGSFCDDPLRLVRAFSLYAQLGFKIEPKTFAQIKKDRFLLKDIAYERIRDELFKILSTDRTADTFRLMDKSGILERIIPHVSVMYRVHQGGYHHLDVWKHSLLAVEELENLIKEFRAHTQIERYLNAPLASNHRRFALMKLATLLHDIGKPRAKKKKNDKMIFYGHERFGRDIVRPIALMLKLSKEERFALEDMVLWHLRPGYLANFKAPTPRAIFRFFRDTKDEALSILILSLADQRATQGPMTTKQHVVHHEEISRALIFQYLADKEKKPTLRLITGDHLIRELKLKPSPVFAKILSAVEEQQALGLIKTKKEALAFAKGIKS